VRLTELQARALTVDELAERLMDHEEPSVQVLARQCLTKSVDTDEIDQLESRLEDARQETSEAEDKARALCDLLQRVLDECEVPTELATEIRAAL
jgi:hypothetical protein